jgi:hypothetical protein
MLMLDDLQAKTNLEKSPQSVDFVGFSATLITGSKETAAEHSVEGDA